MEEITPYLNFTTIKENRNALESFQTMLADSNKLTLLTPTINQMQFTLNEFENIKSSVNERLEFYIQTLDKCSSNLRNAADSLQQKTKIKKVWQIN